MATLVPPLASPQPDARLTAPLRPGPGGGPSPSTCVLRVSHYKGRPEIQGPLEPSRPRLLQAS